MKTSKIIILFMLLLLSANAYSQVDMLMTQQWFSRINRNPAATGNSDNIDLFMLSRFQFTAVDGGPQSNLMNAHSYFDGIRSGLGLSFAYDNLGIASSIVNAKLAYAYHVNLKTNLLLSLGLGAGVMSKSFDPGQHVLKDPTEFGMETFPDEKVSENKPDFDFGFELSMPKFLFGASITHLGRSRDKVTTLTSQQQQFVYARGNFFLSPSFDIAPSVVYTNSGKVNLLALGATVFYKKMLWLGLDYRPPSPDVVFKKFDYSALTAMLGIEYDFFRVGYAYDLSLGKLNDLSYSTHEIMLSFFIPTKSKAKRVQFVQ